MSMRSKSRRRVRDLALFSMLGTLMFVSKLLLEVLPNIHLLGMLTMVYTVVFRKRALIPIYIYVMLNGVYAGFSPWWVPYTYIWTVLWEITMLIPENISPKIACVLYPLICGLHGLAFGVLYAPAQAIMFGYDFRQMLAWIATGIGFDVLHTAGNLAAGTLVLPLSALMKKLYKKA